MTGRNRRGLLMLTLVVLCLGVFGVGRLYGSQGIPGQIEYLFQVVADLAEKSADHDEKIELIVAHIKLMKESLCEIHAAEEPAFCATDCVEGICDTTNHGDPCDSANPPPACDADGGPGGD